MSTPVHRPPIRAISLAELSTHNDPKTCWISIHSGVYDLTTYLQKHPGGQEILLRHAGTEATEAFDRYHPTSLLEQFIPTHLVGLILPQTTRTLTIPKQPKLSQIINLRDLDILASTHLSPKAYAYYSSSADQESSFNRNILDWSKVFLRPRVLRNVSSTLNLSTTICGFKSSFPFFIAPAALAGLAHDQAEKALLKAAANTGVIYVMSSNASCTPEEISRHKTPDQVIFYQVYVNRDRNQTEELLKRVEALGFKAIVLTVDAPVPGKRTRDERFAANSTNDHHQQSVAIRLAGYQDPSLSWEDLSWIRNQTKLPIILKGIQTPEDFLMSHSLGFRHIYLSNHGGRQIDDVSSSAEILVEVRRKCGKVFDECEVLIDGGVRDGSAVVKALGLGARAVGLGRGPMYGLMWGAEGVEKVLRIVEKELEINLRLVGETCVASLGGEHVDSRRLEWWMDVTGSRSRSNSKL